MAATRSCRLSSTITGPHSGALSGAGDFVGLGGEDVEQRCGVPRSSVFSASIEKCCRGPLVDHLVEGAPASPRGTGRILNMARGSLEATHGSKRPQPMER